MPTDIVVIVGDMRLEGDPSDTPTAQALADALPLWARRPDGEMKSTFRCRWWRNWTTPPGWR